MTCKFYTFSTRNSKTFDIQHAFFQVIIAKLSKKNCLVFGPLTYGYMALATMMLSLCSASLNCEQYFSKVSNHTWDNMLGV